MKVLMLASFGLEIVECGGALAAAKAAGDDVHAAVLMCRESSRPHVLNAAKVLGLEEVEFLGVANGEVEVTPEAKETLVELFRRVRPDVVIMQDPEHAQHDLDPDRRMIALLYAESLSVASRDWRIEECGGHPPVAIPTIYYMSPERVNCVVEISEFLDVKQRALDTLTFQNAFSAERWREMASDQTLALIATSWKPEDGNEKLGRVGHRQIFLSQAISHGLGSHSGAVLGEPYRKEGPFVVGRLTN